MTELTCAPSGWTPSRVRIVEPGAVEQDLAGCAAGARLAIVDAGAARDRVGLLDHLAAPHLALAGGEPCKSMDVLERILSRCDEARITRKDALLVVGGGAVGDVGGLAAALWLRGVAHIQVPTTLLSMVDSSVGGKTAIDLRNGGKNLIGAFWPAREVLIDPGFLRTLPADQLASGLGEVYKIAVGLDRTLFEALEAHDGPVRPDLDPTLAAFVIERCIAKKIEVVESDPNETASGDGGRKLLNLGHTVGHAIESVHEFALPHGIAVVRGMRVAVQLALRLGELSSGDADRILTLLARPEGFEDAPLPPWDELEPFVRRDKKAAAGGSRIAAVVPTGIGTSRVVEVGIEDWAAACSQ